MTANLGTPTEYEEHRAVADWLRFKPWILWTSVANERMDVKIATKLKRLGVSPGVPDILIFTPPPGDNGNSGFVGVAIEMKRKSAIKISDHQKLWLHLLKENAWHTFVARGADAAIQELERLGY